MFCVVNFLCTDLIIFWKKYCKTICIVDTKRLYEFIFLTTTFFKVHYSLFYFIYSFLFYFFVWVAGRGELLFIGDAWLLYYAKAISL